MTENNSAPLWEPPDDADRPPRLPGWQIPIAALAGAAAWAMTKDLWAGVEVAGLVLAFFPPPSS